MVEKTGIYEQISHRIQISKILQYILNNVDHQSTMLKLSNESDKFIEFGNGLLNQSNYLSSDAIPKIPKIKEIENELNTNRNVLVTKMLVK